MAWRIWEMPLRKPSRLVRRSSATAGAATRPAAPGIRATSIPRASRFLRRPAISATVPFRPRNSRSVVSVGGTELSKNGAKYSEVVWPDTGGGLRAEKHRETGVADGPRPARHAPPTTSPPLRKTWPCTIPIGTTATRAGLSPSARALRRPLSPVRLRLRATRRNRMAVKSSGRCQKSNSRRTSTRLPRDRLTTVRQA